MDIFFSVPGGPRGKERPRFKRAGNHTVTYTPGKTKEYENLVRLMYRQNAKNKRFDDDEQIEACIVAYFKIPKSASKRRKDEMISGEIRPTKKPDCDNIAKIVLDALNGLAYKDDSQIVSCRIEKMYSEIPRVSIFLESVKK